MMSPTTSNITASHSGAVTGRDVLTLRYNGKSDTVFFSPAPWGKLYKRTLIGNYRFPKDMIHEDQLFTSYAKKNHVDIPHGMHMCPIKVLRILYKSNTAEKFEWYLSEFYPHLFSFYRTIHRIFK